MKKNNNKPKSQSEILKSCVRGNYSKDDLKIIHAKIDAFSDEAINMVNSFGNLTFIYESHGKFKMADIILNYRPEDHVDEGRMYNFISARARELQEQIPNATKADEDIAWAQAEDEWENRVK